MARNSLSKQNTRSAKNPFSLGSFGELTLKYLTGSLGPKNKVISGGYGEGEYNHWYSITLTRPGWIVIIKGGTRPKYINISAYDLNRNPIQGRGIFDADSVAVNNAVEKYYPYLDTVMGAQSDLYNTYERLRLDKGDERYFPLEKGTYLICVSSTRNETLDYGVGIIVEFPINEVFFMLENNDGSLMLTETDITPSNTVDIESPVTVNFVIPTDFNAFSELTCTIDNTGSVEIPLGSVWFIGQTITNRDFARFICEPGNDAYYETIHDHSLSEWRNAWNTTHKTDNEPFPAEFVPYANRP